MKNKKFLAIGLIAITAAMTGTIVALDHHKIHQAIQLESQQKDLTINLQYTDFLTVSNVDGILNLKVLAGKNRKFVVDEQDVDSIDFKIEGNQSKTIVFDVKKNGQLSKEKLTVSSYLKGLDNEVIQPIKRGKNHHLVGFTYTYQVSPGKTVFEKDMFQYSDGLSHRFYYCGSTTPITIKMKSGDGQQFKMFDGSLSTEYEFTLAPEQSIPLTFEIQKNDSHQSYGKTLNFSSKRFCR